MAGWVAVLAGAYFGLERIEDVWVLAVGVAAVLGGSQTLARSLVSQCTPAGNAGAVFALTQLAERGTAWMGPTIFGIVVATTDSYRGALASLLLLFLAAALVLSRIRPATGVADALSYDAKAVYQARRLALPDAQQRRPDHLTRTSSTSSASSAPCTAATRSARASRPDDGAR